MQISTQYASSTAAAMASSVEPDIISVSTHTLKLRARMLAAMCSTAGWTSHWYLRGFPRPSTASQPVPPPLCRVPNVAL